MHSEAKWGLCEKWFLRGRFDKWKILMVDQNSKRIRKEARWASSTACFEVALNVQKEISADHIQNLFCL